MKQTQGISMDETDVDRVYAIKDAIGRHAKFSQAVCEAVAFTVKHLESFKTEREPKNATR